MIRVVRLLLMAAGLAGIAFGLWSMREFEIAQLRSAVVWLVGGVIAHDLVLAPIVVAAGVLVARVVPADVRTPLTVGLVLWGSLTLIAVPALSGLGMRPDNPTLLDRAYLPAWLLLSALIAAAVPAYVGLRRGRRG